MFAAALETELAAMTAENAALLALVERCRPAVEYARRNSVDEYVPTTRLLTEIDAARGMK